jgi:putative ABC transport system permease protein
VAADGVAPGELADALSARLGDTASVEALEVEGLGPAQAAMIAMAALLAVVALANLLATTLAATRERARALGVLRTVGCSTAQLVGQSAIGTAVLGLLAGALAVPVGLAASRLLADGLMTGIGIGPGFASSPPPAVAIGVVIGSAALAACAGALAVVGLARRPAAELVRYE